jgi:hypothetical protein
MTVAKALKAVTSPSQNKEVTNVAKYWNDITMFVTNWFIIVILYWTVSIVSYIYIYIRYDVLTGCFIADFRWLVLSMPMISVRELRSILVVS